MKLNTPIQFSAFCSFLSSIVILFIIVLIEDKYLNSSISKFEYVIAFLLVFLLLGGIIFIFLEIFINKKIRLLYKLIQNQKLTKPDFPKNMQEDVLTASEKDVLDWVKKNQEEIIKLKEDERFRREFIGNLAHELKTPIFSIQGYILTLLEGGLEDGDVNKKFLIRAQKGVDRINRLVQDLDMITKFESEKIEINFEKNDIVKICKDAFEELELMAKEKNIKLCFSKDYSSPISVKCDKVKMGQVIRNLVNNSIYYSNDNSVIQMRFSSFDDNVLIEVEDNGIGIDEAHFPRLFERFYRVDKSRARNEGGTGLGLSIVKHIIEAHNQNIQVRSTLGEGSVFYFTLPKA